MHDSGTMCILRTSLLRTALFRPQRYSDHCIGIYRYKHKLFPYLSLDSILQIESSHYYNMFGEDVGRGTLYLYELVGEPYISMLVGENSFGKMTVGEKTIGEKTQCRILNFRWKSMTMIVLKTQEQRNLGCTGSMIWERAVYCQKYNRVQLSTNSEQ